MFRSRTTLVLGAGASAEVDFPVGRELAESIAPMVDFYFDAGRMRSGDSDIWEALHLHAAAAGERNLTEYLVAGRRVANGMPLAPSIDAFLANNSADKRIELVGKLAIVKSILAAEGASQLFVSPIKNNNRVDFVAIEETWFNRFWHRVVDGIDLAGLAERLSSCTIVSFNYDRCIEHYLYHAIQTYWAATAAETATVLTSLNIYHPYGTVGALPWQTPNGGGIEFGAAQHPSMLLRLATNIRTITQQSEAPDAEVESIRTAIQNSKVVVFLGFSFQRQNHKLLTPGRDARDTNEASQFYATTKGMSDSDQKVVIGMLRRLRKGFSASDSTYNVANLSCCGLFDSYRKSLELAQ